MRTGAACGLVTASHPGPAVVVSVVVGLLAAADGLPASTAVCVVGAVLAGQLTLGWANDLLDARRDRAVDRSDKPLVTGRVTAPQVGAALLVVGVACVGLSLAAGWRSGLVHLLLCVGAGHAYNLGLKATAWSWLPYAGAFGALPAVVTLAGTTPAWPPWRTLLAGAALGVGAHLLNALPDLADDLRTGVRGLPHRLGARTGRRAAAALLVAASVLAAPAPAPWVGVVLLLVAALSAVVLVGQGRGPFRAAMAIAVLDVVLLVGAVR